MRGQPEDHPTRNPVRPTRSMIGTTRRLVRLDRLTINRNTVGEAVVGEEEQDATDLVELGRGLSDHLLTSLRASVSAAGSLAGSIVLHTDVRTPALTRRLNVLPPILILAPVIGFVVRRSSGMLFFFTGS